MFSSESNNLDQNPRSLLRSEACLTSSLFLCWWVEKQSDNRFMTHSTYKVLPLKQRRTFRHEWQKVHQSVTDWRLFCWWLTKDEKLKTKQNKQKNVTDEALTGAGFCPSVKSSLFRSNSDEPLSPSLTDTCFADDWKKNAPSVSCVCLLMGFFERIALAIQYMFESECSSFQ